MLGTGGAKDKEEKDKKSSMVSYTCRKYEFLITYDFTKYAKHVFQVLVKLFILFLNIYSI